MRRFGTSSRIWSRPTSGRAGALGSRRRPRAADRRAARARPIRSGSSGASSTRRPAVRRSSRARRSLRCDVDAANLHGLSSLRCRRSRSVPSGTCTEWYSVLTEEVKWPSRQHVEGTAAAGRDRLRGRARRRRPQPARARRRDRHQPPHAHLPLRLQGGPAHRGDPGGGGATTRHAGRARRRPVALPRRVAAAHVAAPLRSRALAERAAVLRDVRAGAASAPPTRSSSSTASSSRGSNRSRRCAAHRACRRTAPVRRRASTSRSRAACSSTCSRPATAPARPTRGRASHHALRDLARTAAVGARYARRRRRGRSSRRRRSRTCSARVRKPARAVDEHRGAPHRAGGGSRDDVVTVLYDDVGDLPHFNPDDDESPLHPAVADLRPRIRYR